SAFFDEVFPLIKANTSFDGWYGNPHTFIATNSVNLTRETLPENGTLRVWFPLPVETESQRNISMISLQPVDYVVSGPETDGDLGEVCFDIPLEEMTGEYLNISAEYRFTTYERRFDVNPGSIRPYDTTSYLYRKYTASQPNIEITPEVTKLAESIIGNEQNPYRKAELIYEYIIRMYPYSNVPHAYLTASDIPESTYMLQTGFGDCGTQSMLFAALCRSVGVPARSAGGYQLVPGIAGPHFWAEFYLPDYGWIPVDVTIAESADWAFNKTEEERDLFKEYFFGDLDPYRYTIQNDVDIPFSPDPGEDEVLAMVHQDPLIACGGSREDLELMSLENSNITFSEV
ncbi:MAG: transglutaminase domain-containing protein, partial [Methanospirillum sp.]|nr:transglutaminase domain-containing protein [Methanospirillum sp.]